MCDSVPLCKHGREKHACKSCLYSCQHGKYKYECTHCGGNSICTHGKRKTRCDICGKGFCQHGRLKIDCKDCSGSRTCMHRMIKRNCKLCSGSSVCPHRKLKYNCSKCKKDCIHRMPTYKCKTCYSVQFSAPVFPQSGEPLAPVFPQSSEPSAPGFPQSGEPSAPVFPQSGEPSAPVFPQLVQPSAPVFPYSVQPSAPVLHNLNSGSKEKKKSYPEKKCDHNKRPSRCKICDGKDFCQHGRLKHQCVECHGSTICEHNKKRCNCRFCGKSICCHGQYKKWCKKCKKELWEELDIMNDDKKPNKIRLRQSSLIQAGPFYFCVLKSQTVHTCEITPGQTLPEISFTIDQNSVWTIPKNSIITLENGESARLLNHMFGYKVEIQHPFAQPLEDLDAFFGIDSDLDSGSKVDDVFGGFDLPVSDSDSDSGFFGFSQGAQAEDGSDPDIWDI